MPMTEPPENATLSALFMPLVRAALAVRTFALVATRIPKKARKYREACSDDEADGGAEVYEYSDQHKQNYDKYRKYFIFGAKEGTCAFGNSGRDLLHPAVSPHRTC